MATGVHYALKPNRYGETESAYFSHIAKTLYWRNDEALGYGMKFWPEDYEAMKTKIPQIAKQQPTKPITNQTAATNPNNQHPKSQFRQQMC